MLAYIKNILPRLKKYSNNIDKTEAFVGKRWLLLDEDTNLHSYVFLRDGRVILTVVSNGTDQKTIEGTWELLPTNQLYIKRPEPILLEQAFLGDAILVFQESGTIKNPFSLYDPNLIPSGDVEAYLKEFLEVKEAAQITHNSQEYDKEGYRIFKNQDGSLFTGEFKDLSNKKLNLIIEAGREKSRYFMDTYKTDKGDIKVKSARTPFFETSCPTFQDQIFLEDGSIAPDGLYNLSSNELDIKSIEVLNGTIKKVNETHSVLLIMGILFLILLLIGGLVIVVNNH